MVYWYLSFRCRKEFFKQMSILFGLTAVLSTEGVMFAVQGEDQYYRVLFSVLFCAPACVCMPACAWACVCVCVQLSQPSSANAPWKTNSVSVDSINGSDLRQISPLSIRCPLSA